MKVYQGKSKSLLNLSIIIGVLAAIILVILLLAGLSYISGVFIFLFAIMINFFYKGMILKIAIDKEKVVVYRPLSRKTIRISNIAFCMVHGISEKETLIYAFVKKQLGSKTGVRGVKQRLSFEEIIRIINKSDQNVDLDINFNMAVKIPVSFVENSQELKEEILEAIGGHQKRILNNL